MLKKLSKFLIIVLVAIILLNMCQNLSYAAIEVKLDKAYIEKIGQADYHLKYYRENSKQYTYLVCSIVGYYDKNKNFNPTYCMDRNLTGAETDPYYVTTNEILKNDKIWRVIKNGYPYKTEKELGLSSKYDAYAVTKFAVYCILGEADISLFKAETDDKEAVKMLEVLKELVKIGETGKETQNTNPLRIEKIDNLKEQTIEKEKWYYQEYKVTSTSEFSSYEVQAQNLPEGAYVANEKNEKKTVLKNGENFRIYVSNKDLLEDFNIKINVQAQCKAYIILEGKTTKTDTQNYVVTVGEFSTATAQKDLSYKVEKGQVKVIKVDSEDEKIKIPGVTFDVLDKEENKLETITTDENGEAKTSEYKIREHSKIYLKETKTDESYVLNEEPIEIELKGGAVQEIKVQNEKIKGKIKISKTSKDYNKITKQKANTPLENVEFEVYDSSNNLVEKIKTNKKGIAITKDLVKGKYTIKEVSTNKYYFLNTNTFEAEIKENGEVVDVKVQNESKNPDVDVEKTGTERAEVGTEIEYDISLKNTGNTNLENLVLEDEIPYEYIKVTKFKTGTFNQKVKYNFYYKTNFTNDNYVLMMEDLNSNEIYEIDFEKELATNEYITAIKIEFENVDVGFCSNENPNITAKIKEDVKSEETFTNTVSLKGECEGFKVEDKSKWKTSCYKLLPITGM